MKNWIKKIYTKNYFIFIAMGLLPLMWKILEIAFISSFNNGLKIVGQVLLVSILFKIFEETIINPLYKVLGKNKQTIAPSRVRKLLTYVSIAALAYTLIIFVSLNPIMKVSHVPSYIFDDTIMFMRIYVFAYGLGVVVHFLYTNSVIQKNTKEMFVYLLLKSVATTILIIALVPSFAIGLGVRGIAITELVINAISFAYLFVRLLKAEQTDGDNLNKREYLKLMGLSFLETFTRNVVYYFIILVFLNIVDNQEIYYVSTEYIWSIMLVPTLAQNSLIKQELSNNESTNMKPYFINTIFIAIFMIIMTGFSIVLYKYIYNLGNYKDYFYTTLILLPCYIIFIFDAVAESYFIATGKMHHVLVQTIITNIVVYLTAFILYITNIWKITFNSIILLFSTGVIISSIYTLIAYYFDKKKMINN